MKVTCQQLDSYITLYKNEYGEELERTRALTQFQKLLTLMLYMAFPEYTTEDLEKITKEEYTKEATHEG